MTQAELAFLGNSFFASTKDSRHERQPWAVSKRHALRNKCSSRSNRLIIKETLWMNIVVVRNRITIYEKET